MSVLVQFIEWIKEESQKADEEMMEDRQKMLHIDSIRTFFVLRTFFVQL
jgi:hypothetical protein